MGMEEDTQSTTSKLELELRKFVSHLMSQTSPPNLLIIAVFIV